MPRDLEPFYLFVAVCKKEYPLHSLELVDGLGERVDLARLGFLERRTESVVHFHTKVSVDSSLVVARSQTEGTDAYFRLEEADKVAHGRSGEERVGVGADVDLGNSVGEGEAQDSVQRFFVEMASIAPNNQRKIWQN